MWFLYTSDLYISILDINTFIISETTLSNTLFIRKRFKEVLERRMIGPGGYLIFFNIFFISYCDDTVSALQRKGTSSWYKTWTTVGISAFSITDWYKRLIQCLLNPRDRYKKLVQYLLNHRLVQEVDTVPAQSQGPVQEAGTVPLNHRPEKEVGTVPVQSQTGTRSL